jgi:hypothetical protein
MLSGVRVRRKGQTVALMLCVTFILGPAPAQASWWEDLWKYVANKLDKAEKTEQSAQTCPPREPATGKEVKSLNPAKPSSCIGIKLCHYCKYDNAGEFIESGSDLCGVCITAETP